MCLDAESSSGHDQYGDRGPKMNRRSRRGFAMWLLVGWVAFWLTTMVQAACAVDAVPKPLSSNSAAQRYASTVTPGLLDRQCDLAASGHDLTAPPVISTAAVATIADRFDSVTPVRVASEVYVARPQAYTLNTARFGVAPPSPVPLYLRNQRFLI
jgi:hypothetical protein